MSEIDEERSDGEPEPGLEAPRDAAAPPARGAFPKVAVGAILLSASFAALLGLLAADGRGGIVRLVGEAPLSSGTLLLAGYSLGLALTVLTGWLALARRAPVSLSMLPALLLFGGGGVFSALAARAGAAAVRHGDIADRARLVQRTLAHVAFPRVIGLEGASMLAGLAAVIGAARLYRGELPDPKRWGGLVALLLVVVLGASVPLSYSSMSVAVSAPSLLPLLAVHYLGLVVLAFAFPRALRLRAAGDGADPMARGMVLACLACPLGVALAWQASSSAASAAPTVAAGRPLADALVVLGPQAFAVTLAASALCAVAAGPALRRALAPRALPIVALIVGLAAAGAHVWALVAETGIRPPPGG
ncbi:MAG: hypothetical protein HYY06_12220 [Deltaproteobacteria bacterium]|nr:hypothetical protein [Deltaproteobacteria bacterium]